MPIKRHMLWLKFLIGALYLLAIGFVVLHFEPGIYASNLLAGLSDGQPLADLIKRSGEEGAGVLWILLLFLLKHLGLSIKGILYVQALLALTFGWTILKKKHPGLFLQILLLCSPGVLVYWAWLSPLPLLGLAWTAGFYFWRKSPGLSILALAFAAGLSFTGAIASGVAMLLLMADYFIGLSAGKTKPFTYGLGFLSMLAFIWVGVSVLFLSPHYNHEHLRLIDQEPVTYGLWQLANGMYPLAMPKIGFEMVWMQPNLNLFFLTPLMLLVPLSIIECRGKLFALLAVGLTLFLCLFLSPYIAYSQMPERASALSVFWICVILWQDAAQPLLGKTKAWWQWLEHKSRILRYTVLAPLACSGIWLSYNAATTTYSPAKELTEWVQDRSDATKTIMVWPQHHASLLSARLNRPVWSPGRGNLIWRRDPNRKPTDIGEEELMKRLHADPKIQKEEGCLLITQVLLNEHQVDAGGIVYADQSIYVRYLRNWAYGNGYQESLYAAYSVQPNPRGHIKYRVPAARRQ